MIEALASSTIYPSEEVWQAWHAMNTTWLTLGDIETHGKCHSQESGHVATIFF